MRNTLYQDLLTLFRVIGLVVIVSLFGGCANMDLRGLDDSHGWGVKSDRYAGMTFVTLEPTHFYKTIVRSVLLDDDADLNLAAGTTPIPTGSRYKVKWVKSLVKFDKYYFEGCTLRGDLYANDRIYYNVSVGGNEENGMLTIDSPKMKLESSALGKDENQDHSLEQ